MARVVRLLAIALLVVPLVSMPSAHATFPGANGLIAFSRYVNGQNDIWVVREEAGRATRLTRSRAASEGMPDWTADPSRIAYSRCGVEELSNCDIWTMNADGSGKQRLTRTRNAQETWPAWSPDGAAIAFTSNAEDEFQDIYVMGADGSDVRNLTGMPGFDAFPEWSPDGTRIAFTSGRAGPDDIWVMGSDGSNPLQLTSGEAIDERPDWSPDGTTLVFSRDGDIWTIAADGSNPTQLTSNDLWEFAPTFSPEGESIAFNLIGEDGRVAVWLMSSAGSTPRQRTYGLWDFFPDWQPIQP